MAISDLSKEQIEQYAKESSNWKEFLTKCGYTNFGCRIYIKKKLEEFNINITHFVATNIGKKFRKYTDEELFKENSEYSAMKGIKTRLIRDYGWKHECSSCKYSEWMGKQIPIEIDHINGNHTDNRIENLRFLCPNCHALTDTYKGKNIKNKEHSKEKYNKLNKRKICINCNNKKHKNSEYCHDCHIKIKLHKNKDENTIINPDDPRKNKKCIGCNTLIQKDSERCVDCYKKDKKQGIFTKENKNTKNMKKCPDCDNNYISKKSMRCRPCHINLMKTKSETNSKEKVRGKCLDCNTNIDVKAIRCLPCSNKIIEEANKKIKKTCIDCNKNIDYSATRCIDCHLISSRKVERPSYEQLLKDKESMNMVQIGKKYNVSDNTIRKWIKRYEFQQNINNT